MQLEIERRLLFSTHSLPDEVFEVAAVSGYESISKPYRFDVILLSPDHDIEFEKMFNVRATLTIKYGNMEAVFQGIVHSLKIREELQGFACYSALFVPAMQRLADTSHCRVYMNRNVKEIVETVLRGEDPSLDYEFRLKGTYPQRDYVCQYNETNLDFITRLMEHEGISYYFEHGSVKEKIVITDSLELSGRRPEKFNLRYVGNTGMEVMETWNGVNSFTCEYRNLPRKVVLKDYNYRTPSVDLTAEAVVFDKGLGEVFLYGDHFRTLDEGRNLAEIRAQEILCAGQVFHAKGMAPEIRSGCMIELEGHKRREFNRGYLVTEVRHEGYQKFFGLPGLKSLTAGENKPFYRNGFKAVFDDVIYRPERKTPKPLFSGTFNAHIDAEGDGQYAELDSQGRYKVRLPFDRSDAKPGKASAWIRMSQPYAGGNHGMHFPLHRGTEVVLTFINGDPDRPIIAGAMNNQSAPSLINSRNEAFSAIRTSGGNRLVMNDTKGEEFIGLATPFHSSMIAIGSVEGPGSGSVNISTSGNSNSFTLGEKTEVTVGGNTEITLGSLATIMLGSNTTLDMTLGGSISLASTYDYNVTGNTYSFGNANSYSVCADNMLSGTNEVNITAGSGFDINATLKSLKLFTSIGLAATMLSGLACAGADVGFSVSNDESASDISDNWGWKLGTALTTSGLALGINTLLAFKLRSLAKKYSAADMASKITLNSKGIALKADNVGGSNSGIYMQAHNALEMQSLKEVRLAADSSKAIGGDDLTRPYCKQTLGRDSMALIAQDTQDNDRTSLTLVPKSATIATTTSADVKSTHTVGSAKIESVFEDSAAGVKNTLTMDSAGIGLDGGKSVGSIKISESSLEIKKSSGKITFGSGSVKLSWGTSSYFIVYDSGICGVRSGNLIRIGE